MTLQMKPKEFDGPMYSPNRDLAYVYMPFFREVVRYLDFENMSPKLKEFCEKNDVTAEKLNIALKVVTDAHHNYIVRAPEADLKTCLEEAGFNDVDYYAELVLFYTMGVSVNGGFFFALRDATQRFAEPTDATNFSKVLAACREMLDLRIGANPKWSDISDWEEEPATDYCWKERHSVVSSMLNACTKELSVMEKKLLEANKKANAYRDEVYNLSAKISRMEESGIKSCFKKFWNWVTFRS